MTNPRVNFTAESYIEHRLNKQIAWHDAKSINAKKWHTRLRSACVVVSAIVPVISLFLERNCITILLSIAGFVTVALNATLAYVNHGEIWVNYRCVAEALESERYRYLAKAGQYYGLSEEEAYRILVDNVEKTIENSVKAWSCNVGPKKDQSTGS